MDESQLRMTLKEAYLRGRQNKDVSERMIAFGVKYAKELQGRTAGRFFALCEASEIPASLGMEIRKGTRLTAFVELRQDVVI